MKNAKLTLRSSIHKLNLLGVLAITVAMSVTSISCKKEQDELINPATNSNSSNSSGGKSGNNRAINPNDSKSVALVEGGTFLMGSPAGAGDGDERPQHKVTLKSFKITRFEITNNQYAVFLSEKGNQTENGVKWYQGTDFDIKGKKFTAKKDRGEMPVRFVSWNGAAAYAKWAGGRLPTEAEWEYAARGGKKSKGYAWSGSNNIDEVAWYVKNSGQRLHKVGGKKPNELGIYDMSGNVWEWTADWYGPYSKADKTNPKGPSSGKVRSRRGASAFCTAHNNRSANRSNRAPNGVRHNLGFRIVFD